MAYSTMEASSFVTNQTEIQELLRKDGLSLLTPSLVFICILIAVGIPGNFISILVYGIQLTNTTGRNAIIALAVCDIINCCLSIPVELYVMSRYWFFDNGALCKMSRYLTYAMNNSSGLILLAIAFERYRTICTPHKPKIQNSFIIKFSIVLIIIGTLVASPALWIYGIQTDRYNVSMKNGEIVTLIHENLININYSMENSDVWTVQNSQWTESNGVYYTTMETKRCLIDDKMRKTWFTYAHFLFLTVASLSEWFVLLVIYVHIGRKIRRLRTGRGSISAEERMKSSSKRKKHATLVLFLITIAFQFSFIPFLIITNIRFFTEPIWYDTLTRVQKTIYHFLLRSYYLNCAVNPFIYCISSPQFRSAVMKLCQRLKNSVKDMKCSSEKEQE